MISISENDAKHSYQQLVNLSPIQNYSRIGLKLLDHLFFIHRIKTKTKKGVSFADALESSKIMEHLQNLVKRYKKKENDTSIYDVFQLWYGSVNQFRPAFAKWIISRYCPKIRVLDFSAGWGGRAVACMSLNIPYTGIDTNTNLREGYKKLQEYNPTSPIDMIWKPAEHVEFDFPYDMIFTSPPYWKKEVYENMPEYNSKNEWYEIFLIPVIKRAWNGLLINGIMALNFPEEMYEKIKIYLPPIYEMIEMPLRNRNIKYTKKRYEIIYVWKKS